MSLIKLDKSGAGSYGIVYRAQALQSKLYASVADEEHTSSSDRPSLKVQEVATPSDFQRLNTRAQQAIVAVKRNFKNSSADWVGNLRELSILALLTNYPYIVNLLDVGFADPFSNEPMTPVGQLKNFAELMEDQIHFVMDFAEYNLEKFIRQFELSPSTVKEFARHLLLGLEFMHSRNVSHRDLKTGNVLVMKTDEEPSGYRLRICDFGMSQFVTPDTPTTPGVTSSWYRAPEVCLGWRDYTSKIDMWALGCIFYELVTRQPLFKTSSNRNINVINCILSELPTEVNRTTLRAMAKKGKDMLASALTTHSAGHSRRLPLFERVNLSETWKATFDSTAGSLAEFEELTLWLLSFDPEDRCSATEALNHSFFTAEQLTIEKVRTDFAPEPPRLPYYHIYPCLERTQALGLACDLFNENVAYLQRGIKPLRLERAPHAGTLTYTPASATASKPRSAAWYSHRILFHAIDLFDRFLEHHANSSEVNDLRYLPPSGDLAQTSLRFYVCLYMTYKFFATLKVMIPWIEFIPDSIRSIVSGSEATITELAERFERYLVVDVCGFMLYRETLLEIPNHYRASVTETDVRNLLSHTAELSEPWTNKSVRALYRTSKSLAQSGPVIGSPATGPLIPNPTLYRFTG